MVDSLSIAERVLETRRKIEEALVKSGQGKRTVRLVAVTKTRTVEEMVEAVHGGVDLIGENRVQEAVEKRLQWPEDLDISWHMVGYLQRNKAKKALEVFSCIQSLSTKRLADTLQRLMTDKKGPFPVLIEANISQEESKHGVDPSDAEELAEYVIGSCPGLRLEGFMGIAPFTEDEGVLRRSFSRLRCLRDEISTRLGVNLPELSMGMSNDFEIAVEEGSTMIRIGTALFGGRKTD